MKRATLLLLLPLVGCGDGEPASAPVNWKQVGDLRAVVTAPAGTAAWGAAEAIFAVGARGVTLVHDGDAWRRIDVPDTWELDALARSPSSEVVLAVGCDVYSGRGVAFSLPSEAVYSVAGVYPCLHDVVAFSSATGAASPRFLAVGEGGAVVTISPGANAVLEQPTSVTLHGIADDGYGGVWVVGEGGTVLHRAASGEWTETVTFFHADLYAVYSGSANDAVAVGAGGFVAHFDGSYWREATSGTTADLFDVRAVWWPTQTGGSSVMVAVGSAGTILRRRAVTWQRSDARVEDDLFGVWGEGRLGMATVVVGARATVLELVAGE